MTVWRLQLFESALLPSFGAEPVVPRAACEAPRGVSGLLGLPLDVLGSVRA